MNSNTFLKMFGLNPDDFEPSKEGLIECEYGYMVDLALSTAAHFVPIKS